MILSYWTLFVALSLSVVAAWYSIAGLTAIFAAAAVPIIIMGAILEVAKVTITVWMHEYWSKVRLGMKLYLVPALFFLMVITSMGIFGFLSKAHLDQGVPTGDVAAKVSLLDEKIKTERDNIDTARRALQQMDSAVDQTLGRSTTENGADKAVAIRRSQAKERASLQKEIADAQKKIAALNEERAPIASELRKVEAEVGPIKYIAALIYGDNPDANVLERAVRWVIIILVIVFDPLAIMMVLAATESIKWNRETQAPTRRKQEEETLEDLVEKITPENLHPDQHTHIPVEDYYKSLVTDPLDNQPLTTVPVKEETKIEPVETNVEEVFVSPNAPGLDASDERPGDYLTDTDLKDKYARSVWKEENPGDTLKHQRQLLDAGKINELPWETEEFKSKLALQPDNLPTATGDVLGFGTAFPTQAVKGNMFLRTDSIPSRLFKFNGARWIEIDKKQSDSYAYDTEYIKHLIAKIESGEYDPELLSDAERDQIANYLN